MKLFSGHETKAADPPFNRFQSHSGVILLERTVLPIARLGTPECL